MARPKYIHAPWCVSLRNTISYKRCKYYHDGCRLRHYSKPIRTEIVCACQVVVKFTIREVNSKCNRSIQKQWVVQTRFHTRNELWNHLPCFARKSFHLLLSFYSRNEEIFKGDLRYSFANMYLIISFTQSKCEKVHVTDLDSDILTSALIIYF